MLLEIIKGVDNSKRIDKIDEYLFGLVKTQEYSGKKGVEVVYVKKYEEMSLILTKYANKDAKQMTFLEYYQAFHSLKKESKAKTKASKRRNRK